ncbi:MAG: FmdB family zinc ribbon protein [Acidiferrobacterales bacterium]
MPTYEYECPKCGEKFELIQKISENNPPQHCEGTDAKRIISKPALFVLKGGGWAKDGYSK